MTSKSKIFIAFLCVLCASVFNTVKAQTGITIKKPLTGNLGQLSLDSTVTVIDSMYYDPVFAGKLDKPYPVRNIITFKLDETSEMYLGDAMRATALLRIVYTNESGVTDSIEKSFAINYEEGKTYTSRQSFVFNNAHTVTVRVLNVTITSGGAYTIGALMVENQMDLFPHYKFVCATDAVQTINFSTPSAAKPDELSVSWPAVSGATEYDLEWAYADSFALASGRYLSGGQPVAALIFEHNATRITTTNLSYNIPLLFDHAGSLFFRVRAVSSQDRQRRITTDWSTNFTGGLGRYDFAGHEPDMNWQSTISYAEEGKRKAVVQYYDGSLRSRQTVTKDNTQGTTVVAETLYDYQGRPAIQVMPAPTLNTIIGYSKQFNVGLNGAEYEKQVYDSITPGNSASAPAMGTQSGASQYYSANNRLKTGYHAFIPDANGYVFTQTKYTQDNTGRIAAQSGVGEVYQLGKGHETKYYYGSPDQNELDALFGTEVGYASHYFKNMVQDANGQYSISYVDMHGRTIATALAGTPDSVKLAPLSSYASRSLTENLLTTRAVKDLVMESKKSLLVSKKGVHNFHYALDPQSLQKDGCNAQTFCYSCLYDLEIKITDDENNRKLGGKPFDTVIHNFSLGAIPADCNGQVAFNVNFDLELEPGSYEITKLLSINREGAAYLRDSLFLLRNTCISYDQQVAIQRTLQKESSCEPDCASCTAALGSWNDYRNNYMVHAGIAIVDSAANRGAAWTAYQAALEACKSLCDKRTVGDDARSAMLQDMSAPAGQYADITRSTDKYSIFYDDPSTDTDIPKYRAATIQYLNEEGMPDSVYCDSTGTYVIPQKLSPAEFAAKFKTSWATALLPYHPEYCKLQVYDAHAASLAWDKEFEATDTYAAAVSRGYLNPTGGTGTPFSQYASNSYYTDPLSQESSTFKTQIENKLTQYQNTNTGYVTLWASASLMAKCGANDNACANTYRQDANSFGSNWCTGDLDMAWRMFRTLYLNVKQNIYGDLQNSCSPTGAQLITAGHTLNFQNASQALGQNGLGDLASITDVATGKAAADAKLAEAVAANCQAYVKMWVKQLSPCNYDSADVANNLVPKLLQVCKEGGDAGHPFGASTVKPGSTYAYHSFAEVLSEYRLLHPNADVLACNAELITAPLPYNQQVAYSEKPIWTKPDSCECSTINSLYNAYLANPDGAVSFSVYIKKQLNTTMSDSDLQQLRNRCNTTSSCNFLAQPIKLPPALQCNVGTVCITCVQMDSLNNLFSTAYPGVVPTIVETDSVQQLKNQLYANFLNNRLGFSKQAWEYLQFDSTCHISEHSFRQVSNVERVGIGGAALEEASASKKYFQQPFDCGAVQNLRTSFNSLYPLSMGDTLTLTKVVPVWRTAHIRQTYDEIGDVDTSWTSSPTLGINAGTWTNGNWFNVRGNIVFDLSKLPGNATINNAWLNLYAKDTLAELYTCCGAHYRRDTNYVYGILERALGSVQAGVTNWGNQPATTAVNRVILPTPKYTNGNGNPGDFFSDQDYTGIPCTDLVRDMYAQPSYQNYGVIFRLSEENLFVYKMYTFWANSANTPAGKKPTITVNCRASRRDMFTAYVDSALNQTYTTAFLESMLQNYCGEVSANTNTLCGKSEPVYPDVPLEHMSACDDSTSFIISTATDIFNARRDSLKGSFDSAYFAKCLAAQNYETFTVVHASSEYHYTLYYYDQAGNLLKTVPPAGVVYNDDPVWLSQVKAARAAGTALPVTHNLVTSYRYNILNQVVTQSSPDGGTSNFWYDRLGRLAVSQNAKQQLLNQYSYTQYDYLGRIAEVGQLTSTTVIDNVISRNATALSNWLDNVASSREQITKTVYDEAYGPLSPVMDAKNLRSRVSYTALYNNNADYVANNHASATFYTYDIHGNVDTLLQDYKQGVMAETGNRFKKIVYRYDLISGKVNHVAYQPNQPDAFYHRYNYDAENRVTSVETSRDSIYWETDARYNYYKHGPLARSVIGHLQVQGMDYAYTLQGWIKGLNSTGRDTYDMGRDSRGSLVTANDALAYTLYYYGDADYKPIDADKLPFSPVNLFGNAFKPLYNGNIAAMSSALSSRAGSPILSMYSYDQLNRITESQSYGDYKRNENRWEPEKWRDFYERFSYDANGNIQDVKRNGMYDLGHDAPDEFDSLHYHYKPGTNQLDYVSDAINSGGWPYDLKDQSPGNYTYDAIGNLVKDNFDGIADIRWTVYGKIDSITKSNGTTIKYTYDASGNRISKTVYAGGTPRRTWYTKDAQGNTMLVYTGGDASTNNGDLTATETYLYGSSRVGQSEEKINVQNLFTVPSTNMPFLGTGYTYGFTRGIKGYELSNHLGNVMIVVSDAKAIANANTQINVINSYDFVTKTTQDFYAFGMLKYGRRNYDNQGYRYGFNGKENDNDVQGDFDLQDYGMRIYDPRLGRFLSVDPLTAKYPYYTPYQFAGNTPIQAIDLDGAEEFHYRLLRDKEGVTRLQLLNIEEYDKGFFGTGIFKSKLPERYIIEANNTTYYIGFGGAKGYGNNDPVTIGTTRDLLRKINGKKFDPKVLSGFYYDKDEAWYNFLNRIQDRRKEVNWGLLTLGIQSALSVEAARAVNVKGFEKGSLQRHYEKHGSEFGDVTQNEYAKMAKEFSKESGETIKETVVGNFYVKFDESTRRTLISHVKDREIRTFYKADYRDEDPFVAAIQKAIELTTGKK